MPADRIVNANTDATTTNAIRMMAVSNAVIPASPRIIARNLLTMFLLLFATRDIWLVTKMHYD
jgi:hypothetical protein